MSSSSHCEMKAVEDSSKRAYNLAATRSIVQERILKLHEALQKEKERLKNHPDDDEEYLKTLQDMLKDAKEELNGISKA